MRSWSSPRSARALLRRLIVPVLLGGCGSPPPPAEMPWHEDVLRTLDTRGHAAQLVMAALPLSGDSAPATSESRLLDMARSGGLGGVVVRGGAAPAAAASVRALQATAPIPLLVLIDLDGGASAIAGLSPFPPVRSLAALAPTETAREVAVQSAREARSIGADLGLFRVPPTNRGGPLPPLARNPERLAEGFRAYLAGLDEEGLLAAVQILWTDTTGLPTVDWDRARLGTLELPVLEPLVRTGVSAIGLGAVRMAAITGDTVPLPLSPTAVRGLLRRDLGFGGIVLADLSPDAPLAAAYGEPEGAVRAIAAGADVVVGVTDPAGVVAALEGAVRSGRLPASRVRESAARVLALKARTRELRADSAGEAALAEVVGTPEARELVSTTARLPRLPEAPDSTFARLPALQWPPAPTLARVPASEVGMSEARLAGVDRALRAALDDSTFTAAAVAVGRRGGLVMLEGYGRVGEGEGAYAVDGATTLFDIASLSKVIGTTSAVALLLEERRMTLDAPVRRFLPEFQGSGKGDVRIRHLLTHTSGLPSGIWLYGATTSPRAAVARVLEQPLRAPPGSRVEYSDLGMILLAEAVERAAEMPLDHFLALRLFAPLGMSSTMYLPPAALRGRTVPTAARSERDFPLQGVVHDANAFRLGGVTGHAGLFSTARDLAVFAQTMLNGGSYGTARILAPATVRAFTTRQPGAEQRALGWDTPSRSGASAAGAYFSARSFGHTGFTGTSLWIDPEKELFVVLLTNRTFPDASPGDILRLRAAVHDAAARAITDAPVRPRPQGR